MDSMIATDVASSSAASSTSIAPVGGELYQGIRCGRFAFAVSYRWARSIAESFDEVPIPKAPIWLVGATAIDGQIRPIIDLALLVDPGYRRVAAKRELRLLIGGSDDGDSLEPPIALLFEGLPQQLRSSGHDVGDRSDRDNAALPAHIAALVEQSIRSVRDETFYVINMAKLANTLASELSVL
jgi:chemotaxis signal transduction protein